MNPQKSAEDLIKFGVETATIPVRVLRNVGQFAVGRVNTFLEGGADIVERQLATMPINEAKIASELIDIADNKLEFPTDPVTLEQQSARENGRRIQKAMRRDGFNRLGRAVLYADANPIVPDPVTDEVVAIATRKHLNPERSDPDEFPELERKRTSNILMSRQGNRPPFSVRQVVRAIFRP